MRPTLVLPVHLGGAPSLAELHQQQQSADKNTLETLVADLTPAHAAAARAMRHLVDASPNLTDSDREWADDKCLLRYLRARHYDVPVAYAGLLETVKWRSETHPDTIPTHPHMSTQGATGKQVHHGFSVEGHPVLYLVPRHENSSDEEQQFQFILYNLELAIRRMSPAPHAPEKLALVIDLGGMAFSKRMSLDMQKRFISTLGAHYPERLWRAFILNAPWFFSTAWKVIGPFLDPVTRSKIAFVSAPTAVAKEQLASSGSSMKSSASTHGGRWSLGGLWGGSRSKGAPAAEQPSTETSDPTVIPKEEQGLSSITAALDTTDLLAAYGGKCTHAWDAVTYFERAAEFIAESDRLRGLRVAAVAAPRAAEQEGERSVAVEDEGEGGSKSAVAEE
ncbi:CRAL-TRIO domain-containing protein [Blastocladiella britannica]|nr:CRAL-TRIO domain-containing protein [Blastocladiella britannica]